MANAATTARATPGGIRMEDGYQTLLAFELDSNIDFWEKTVSPFGLDGEDEIPTTTMHNTLYRTFYQRALITITECVLTVAYDPCVMENIINNRS